MLALTAALVAPYFIDWTSYRASFEREASRILGREVTVEGSASARLLPFPSVTFSDVTVAGVEPGQTAMTIETFSMDAELAPFMRGDIYIFDMRLVRPNVMVDVDESGNLDWAVRPSVPIEAEHIALEKLTITEGKVSVRHAVSGRTHQLTEINADVSARALTGPWRMDGSLRLDGMRTQISASTGSLDATGGMRMRLRAEPERYPLALETDGNVRIEEGRGRYAGQFRLSAPTGANSPTEAQQAQAAPPAYRVGGIFEFDHEMLKVPEFRFETGTAADPYTADGSAEFALGRDPRFSIRADGAQIRFAEGEEEEGSSLSLDQRLVAFREFVLDMPRPTVPGRLEVRLPAIVAGDTTIRDVHLLAEPAEAGWTVASLGATLPGRTTLEADGVLTVDDELGFDGSLLLAVGQPSGFAAWLSKDVDEAIRRLPAAGFSAEVALSEGRQSFRDLELVLGDARFKGEITSLTPADADPSMTLKLDGSRLDIEGMTAFASLFVAGDGTTRLTDRDIAFEIVAGPVTGAGLRAETLDTALRLKDGTLEIDRLSIGELAGANISATGAVRDLGPRPTGNIDATVISTDLAPLAEMLSQRFPDNTLLAGLVRRAELYPGLLEEASVQVVASSASDNGSSGLALSATGEVGGTDFSLTATADAMGDTLADTPLRLDLTAENDEAAALYAAFGLPALPVSMVGRGETELSFDGSLAEGGATRFVFSGDGLSASFEGDAGFDGKWSVKGEASVAADDLEPWLATAGVAMPGMGFGLPVELRSQLDIDDGLLMLSGLDGEAGGSNLSGDINAEVRDGLPHLSGSLDLGELDLAAIAEIATGAPALNSDGEGWPGAPFSQRVATPATTDLELAADTLYLGGVEQARDARMNLRVGRDGISISNATAHMHGGTLSGIVDFTNDNGTGLFSSQIRIAGADVESLLGDAGVAGKADLTATLTSSGKSIDGVVSALAGSGTATVRGVTIEGIDPKAFPALLERADTFGPNIDATATAGFAPDLIRRGAFGSDGVDIAFTVAGGRVRAPPIRMETEGAILTAEVGADLGEATVQAEATLAYDPGMEALVGSEPAVRLVAAGPLGDIGVLVETEPLAQFLTQRALEREQQRVEAMQAALLEQQRHRREIRYYAALADERRTVAEEARRQQEEQERLKRELRARDREEAQRRADELRRQSELLEERRRTEEAERRQIEEQTRLNAEEAERAAAAERQRSADDRLRRQVEELLRGRDEAPGQPAASDAVPLAPPVVDVTPSPAPRGQATPSPSQQRPAPAPPAAGGAFSEENMTLRGLLQAIGRGER